MWSLAGKRVKQTRRAGGPPGGWRQVGGWGLVGAALSRSTCHLPQLIVTPSRWQRRSRGTEEENSTAMLENLHIAFTTILHLILSQPDLAPVSVVNYTTVILVFYYANINGGNTFGEPWHKFNSTYTNLHMFFSTELSGRIGPVSIETWCHTLPI